MYPINHYHPLRPRWPVLSSFLSETLPSVWLNVCIHFLIWHHLSVTCPCSGDGLCVSVCVSRPLDLQGAEWEVSVWARIKRDSWHGSIRCNYGGCDWRCQRMKRGHGKRRAMWIMEELAAHRRAAAFRHVAALMLWPWSLFTCGMGFAGRCVF